MEDVVVIGSGPAGLSAAINVRARGKSVLVVANSLDTSNLDKAPEINNYPGLPGISGKEMIERFVSHGTLVGVRYKSGRVVSVLPYGEDYMVALGGDVVETHAVILTLGAVPQRTIPGELEYLGHGVSYCATCDGMLYRNRPVAVVGNSHEALEDAKFLAELTPDVTYVSNQAAKCLPSNVNQIQSSKLEIVGDGAKATSLRTDSQDVPVDCVFILRKAIAPASLVEGIEMDGAYIKVNRDMATNIKGVFAAGDCTGNPKQVAKAVGEGQIAGLAACALIDERKNN